MAYYNPILESKALPPRDPALTDENEWPGYVLRNVEVTSNDGKVVSLLDADPTFPVTIIGRLELEKSKAHLLLPEAASKSPNLIIKLTNIDYYCYGAHENGDVDVWAAGKAGWFLLKPAASYTIIFQGMLEAVNIFYFISDCYKSGKISVDELYAKYARIHHITPLKSKEKFYSHGRFLASRMMKGEEGIGWGHTSFYQSLRKKLPEAFGKATLAAPTPTYTMAARTQKETALSRSNSTTFRASRSRRAQVADIEKDTSAVRSTMKGKARKKRGPLLSEVNKTHATTIWKFMQHVVSKAQPEPAEITIKTFAQYLYQSFTLGDLAEAELYMQYLAPDLISMMQKKRRRTYEWPELPIYDELLESKLTPTVKRKMAAVSLEWRAEPLLDEEDDQVSSIQSGSSEEEVLNADEVAHRTKSSLRPKRGSKFSGKGAGRKGKAPHGRNIEAVEPDGDSMDVDTPSKRKSSHEHEVEDDVESPPTKRFTRSQGDDDPELQDLEFAWQQAKSTGISVRRKERTQSSVGGELCKLKPAVESVPVSSTIATDPGDIWTCTHEGCLHRVYGASEELSKDLINEHIDEHKSDKKMNLIFAEESLTRLPVSNLIKRIREMAEMQNGAKLVALMDPDDMINPITTLFPQRITKRI